MKIIEWFRSRFSRLSTALLLVFLGFATSFGVDGYLNMIPGFSMASAAILLVSSPRDDSLSNAVAGFLFGSWFMLVFAEITAPVLAALFVCFFYFMFEADHKITVELWNESDLASDSGQKPEK